MKKYLPHLAVFIFLFGVSFSVIHAQGTSGTGANPGGGMQTPSNGGGMQTPGTSQGTPQNVDITLKNPFKGSGKGTIQDLIQTIITAVILPIGGVIAVLSFIYSGFLYVTAQGAPAEIEKANRALLYTAIGTAVLLGSWTISKVLENTVSQLLSS